MSRGVGFFDNISKDPTPEEIEELRPFKEKWHAYRIAVWRWAPIPFYLIFRASLVLLPEILDPLLNTDAFRTFAFIAACALLVPGLMIWIAIREKERKVYGHVPCRDYSFINRLQKGKLKTPFIVILICELLIDAFFLFDLV